MVGTTFCFPLEVTWSGDDVVWATLWVTDFGDHVSVMATSQDTGHYEGVEIPKDDGEFSRLLFAYARGAVELVTEPTETKDGHETWTAERR